MKIYFWNLVVPVVLCIKPILIVCYRLLKTASVPLKVSPIKNCHYFSPFWAGKAGRISSWQRRLYPAPGHNSPQAVIESKPDKHFVKKSKKTANFEPESFLWDHSNPFCPGSLGGPEYKTYGPVALWC